MKVGIFGIGAIGSVLSAALISNKNINLQFFSRSPKEKIKLHTPERFLEYPIKLSTSSKTNPPLDWLVICLKANQYSTASADLKQLVSPGTKVAVIRNGLQHKSSVASFTPDENILECIIDAPAQLTGDGSYELLSLPIITCPEGKLALEFSDLLEGAFCPLVQTVDFKTDCWKKLCESATLGAILTLSGNTAWILKDPKVFDLYKSLLQETITVAIADGAQIEIGFIENLLKKATNYPPHKSSSMLQDKLAGKPIELEAKNAVVATLGKRHSISTPISDILVTLLTIINMKSPYL